MKERNAGTEFKKKIAIYLILADENLFHPHYLKELLFHLENSKYKIVGITLAKDSYRKGFSNAVIQQIKLWGFFPFTFIVGVSLWTSSFTIFGILQNKTIKSIARKEGIPFLESYNVNENEHLRLLRKKRIDIIISSCGHIFKKELLSIPKVSCINRHSALLPKYGGVLPVFWAMKNNEEYIGVSVHKMVNKIDQGDILAQKKIKIKKGSSLFYNYVLAFYESADVTKQAVDALLAGKIYKNFFHNEKEYFSFPSDKDIKDFKKKNKSFNLEDIYKYYKIMN